MWRKLCPEKSQSLIVLSDKVIFKGLKYSVNQPLFLNIPGSYNKETYVIEVSKQNSRIKNHFIISLFFSYKDLDKEMAFFTSRIIE